MKIVWTEPAVEDLRELHAYIARDSEVYASGFVERIILAAELLVDYPKVGPIVPESNDENIRELLFQRYRIIYRVKNDCLEMLSVLHGARDLAELKPAPWEVG
jgi:plasmid stabilization system protein ParE